MQKMIDLDGKRKVSEESRPNLVRKYRRWAELSQAQLAAAVGVSRQTIANVERGNYSPSVHLALDICRTLGKTVEEIFGEPAQERHTQR